MQVAAHTSQTFIGYAFVTEVQCVFITV